jgi:hypothetical protein
MARHGWNLRGLEEQIPYSRSTISDNLSGKVPPEQFVIAVVNAVVKEPRKREHDLVHARQLWKEANKPPQPAPVAAAPSSGAELVLAQTKKALELSEQNRELEKGRAQAHQMVLLLIVLTTDLRRQVAELSSQPTAGEDVALLREQLRIAENELERARQARVEAERLAVQAQAQATSLQEQLAQMRSSMPTGEVLTADLPPELEEEYFLADVDRALRTAEGFLQEGAERRERLASEIAPTTSQPRAMVGQGWKFLALLASRTLGCLLMMTGAGAYYSLNTWVTRSDFVLGFPALLVAAGVLLLLDPWDIVEQSLWPYARGWLNDQRVPFTWPFTSVDILTRFMRITWGVGATIATVLSLAALYWWSLWVLTATVPAALGTMGYAVLGQNRGTVSTLAPLFSHVADVFRAAAGQQGQVSTGR